VLEGRRADPVASEAIGPDAPLSYIHLRSSDDFLLLPEAMRPLGVRSGRAGAPGPDGMTAEEVDLPASTASRAGEVRTLHGDKLGVTHVTSMVIGAAAPVANVTVALALGIALGNGAGMPGMVVLSTVVFGLFAIGYTRALPLMQHAGAFYVYVTRGLGRIVGLSAAFVSTCCYMCFAVVLTALTGYLTDRTVVGMGGPHISWFVWCLVAVGLAVVLSWRQVNVGASALAVILLMEIISVTILVAAILIQQGFSAFDPTVFAPSTVFSGAVGVAMLYSFTVLLGFESTAVYSEEARNPRRTIPRATYAVLGISGVIYVIGAWAIVAGAGAANVQSVASENPVGFVFDQGGEFVGPWFAHFLFIQSTVSCFAGVIAVHNNASRYIFAVARDGFLPRTLATVHPRHGVPTRAAAVDLIWITLVLLGFWLAGQDPVVGVATTLQGVSTIGILALYALTSLAIAAFFIRRQEFGFRTVIAPLISAVLLGVLVAWAADNYHLMSGTEDPIINRLPWLLVLVALAGAGAAAWAKRNRPARYEHIGTRVHSE
jgi:amino acid transporter